MNAATRGVILAVIGVALGVFILGRGFDGPPDLVAVGVTDPPAQATTEPDPEAAPAAEDGTETPTEDPTQDPTQDEVATETPVDTPDTGGPPDILHTPSEVRLLVVNGTDVGGAAGTVNNTFRADGYNGLEPVNSDPANSITETMVYYAEGYLLDAQRFAQALNAPTSSVAPLTAEIPVTEISEAHVVIVLGSDLVPTA